MSHAFNNFYLKISGNCSANLMMCILILWCFLRMYLLVLRLFILHFVSYMDLIVMISERPLVSGINKFVSYRIISYQIYEDYSEYGDLDIKAKHFRSHTWLVICKSFSIIRK